MSLSPRALAELLDTVALQPALWEPRVRHEPAVRWYGSLYRDDVVDLWLLTWQQDNSTDLHDHGGSGGAFRVLSGALAEDRPVSGRGGTSLARSRRSVGQTVAFGPRLVHDVHNVEVQPAVSLHVYSPPLTSMTYYKLAGERLAPRFTEPVEVRSGAGRLPERAVTVDA
ncbi:MAG TPA: cysteine dioxygenase family protein [Frankiaceae bacterium]|nr:cysteine dioxygenase family protein [Frankiaceae bacterium]